MRCGWGRTDRGSVAEGLRDRNKVAITQFCLFLYVLKTPIVNIFLNLSFKDILSTIIF